MTAYREVDQMAAEEITDRLRRRRQNIGLRQWKLARELGLHANRFGMYERGERLPTLPVLIRWARALGMDVRVLSVGAA